WLGTWREARVTEPLGFLDFLALERAARKIVTDSGGVQREAFLLGRPCVTVYATTPWVETVEHGWNSVVGTDPDAILAAIRRPGPTGPRGDAFGDGRASRRIVEILSAAFEQGCAHPRDR
ncbi:MAG: UDP-N-acetylglucosamine 2-epimerase, partial [Deltaproteobacteria bacterium]|nr:UDP-N-acetylglucosamine 2-epimerase [Deltaproteobacteria bacterium]